MQIIAEAFATWRNAQERISTSNPQTFERLTDDLAKIEDAAVQLPAATAQDVWQLLAMTIYDATQPSIAAVALFERARKEAVNSGPIISGAM
jgi:hypothetical protein